MKRAINFMSAFVSGLCAAITPINLINERYELAVATFIVAVFNGIVYFIRTTNAERSNHDRPRTASPASGCVLCEGEGVYIDTMKNCYWLVMKQWTPNMNRVEQGQWDYLIGWVHVVAGWTEYECMSDYVVWLIETQPYSD